ncbi:NFACT family protein [Bacillus cytotoxicus]
MIHQHYHPCFACYFANIWRGGFIEKIEQIDLERIIQITVRSRNEIGDESLKTLIIEIMGRHSNIILVDEKNKYDFR